MDKRKSLAHMILENQFKTPASPLRRRSSIAIQPVSADIRVNDDEAERAVRRKETVVSSPSRPNASRRSFTLDTVNRMSAMQIADGIAECMRLNTQNKISKKNAFSLHMIDFMAQMVASKGDVSNLQMASQSLDVCSKIYGLRVDVLHQEIIKMVGNLGSNDNNASNVSDNSDGPDGTSENTNPAEEQKKKKKKKKRNTKIFTTIEQLQGPLDVVSLEPVMFGETDYQTSDMLYQAMFPQHFNSGVSLHPFNDVVFDTADPVENETENIPKIAWPPLVPNERREICNMFTNFEFLNWSAEHDANAKETASEPSLSQEQLAFDLDASLPIDNPPIPGGLNYFDIQMDNDEADMEVVEANAPVQNVIVNKIIENVPKKNLEYSYLEDVIDIDWVGPSHWKIKPIKNLGTSNLMEACRQNPVKKKKSVLVIDDDIMNECEQKFATVQKNKTKLKPKTTKTAWSDDKITHPMENYDNEENFMCKLELRPDIIKFVKSVDLNQLNNTVVSDGAEGYDYTNEHDMSNYCPNVMTDHPGDDNEANDGNNGSIDVDPSQPGFTGTNLVEAPKYTQKIFIPFSQRAKKLNMHHLKKCIWSELASVDEEEKENAENENVNQPPTMSLTGEKHFSDIYSDLPAKLTKNDAKDLSFAIAFISLLHVANEKSLKLMSNENLSDIIITQEIAL